MEDVERDREAVGGQLRMDIDMGAIEHDLPLLQPLAPAGRRAAGSPRQPSMLS
jgi:hypothetical protein